jgi:short-subunit dehydrogenase
MLEILMMLQLFISPPRCTSLERLKAKVKGKTVLITGASFGIGEATALLLARAGAEVLLVARTEEKLASLAETIRDQGGKATVYVADLYKAQEVSRLVTTIKHDYPHIALIVSNAGKSIRRKITDSFGRDDLERCLALNFSSPAQLIMAFLPDMVQRGRPCH